MKTGPQDVQIMDTKRNVFEQWMDACGLVTVTAAADTLGVHRHTAEAMKKGRLLTKMEGLAMAAAYHRIKPFDRS